MKKHQTFSPKTDLHEDRPDKIDAADASFAALEKCAMLIPAANNRHNAGSGFKSLQNMLGLQPPGARNKYPLNLDGPMEIQGRGPGCIT
jgi:hypothetical protein